MPDLVQQLRDAIDRQRELIDQLQHRLRKTTQELTELKEWRDTVLPMLREQVVAHSLDNAGASEAASRA